MKSISALQKHMAKVRSEVVRVTKEMPRYLGTEAVKATRENFIKGGFEGAKWDARSDATMKSYKYKTGSVYRGVKKKTKVLRVTNTLFEAIHYVATPGKVSVGINKNLVPYGVYHNEGGGNLPVRQWIGYTTKLKARLKKRMDFLYKKALNPIKR